MARKSGELWISKTTPHTLKYYAGGIEYWANSATTYIAGEDLKKGQILVATKNGAASAGEVVKAQYPTDLTDVIGVALNDALDTFEVRVLNYGYIDFNRTELENAFITQSDITVGPIDTAGYYSAGTTFGTMADSGGGNGWDYTGGTGTWTGKGAPIYWYQGRVIKTSASTYEMKEPSSKRGLLTFATPSGYKYPSVGTAWGDASFNVAYEKLPVIGNVVEYTYDGSDNIDTMVIHVNFSKFNRNIEFSYPAAGLYLYDDSGVIETTTIRHGLFTDSLLLNHTDVKILGSSDSGIDGEIIEIHPGFTSIAADSLTNVDVTSDSDFYGKMVGEVRYIL